MRKCWTHNSRTDQAAVLVGGCGARGRRQGLAGSRTDSPGNAQHTTRHWQGGAGGAEWPGCGARGRRQSLGNTKSAHNFPRSLLKTAQKHCNSNDANSNSEIVTGELRAKLLSSRQDGTTHSRTSRAAGVKDAGGAEGTQARLRCPWAAAGPGRALRRRAEPEARGADSSRAGHRPRRSPAQTCVKPRPADAGRGLPTQSGGRV